MTPKEANQIALEIVKNWPESDCDQVDTFAVMSDHTLLDVANLGMERSDYNEGEFWSREYELQGQTTLTGKFPMIAVDIEVFNVVSNNFTFIVKFIGKTRCTTCGNCHKGISAIKDQIREMAMLFHARLFDYNQVDNGGGEVVWSTTGASIGAPGKMKNHVVLQNENMEVYQLFGDKYIGELIYSIHDSCVEKDTSGFAQNEYPYAKGHVKCKTCV